MSTRNAQAQREPAGRTAVGGRSAVCATGVSAGTIGSSLGERQLAGSRVVVENLRVTSPLDRGFQLTPRFIFAEVLVQQIPKEFVGQRSVRLCLQRLLHLPQQRHVRQRRPAENLFSRLNIPVRKLLAL